MNYNNISCSLDDPFNLILIDYLRSGPRHSILKPWQIEQDRTGQDHRLDVIWPYFPSDVHLYQALG